MADSRRNSPKAARQGPAQSIPFDHPDPVAPDDHFEIEVDPGTHVETSEQTCAQPGGEARPTASEGGPEAEAGTDPNSGVDETPEENWSLDKLARYAARAEERARRFAHLESAERFRQGKALHFAHQKTPWGQWDAWLDKTFTFSRMTAWRAEQLYLRATERYGERAEEACGNQSITDLYIGLGIKKKDEWLIEGDGEQPPALANGQGGQQPTVKKDQTKKRKRAKGKGQDKSQPAARKTSTLLGGRFPSADDGEPGSGDDADESASEENGDQDSFPNDPRSHAEKLWEQQYAAHELIGIAANSLQDALERFSGTMPEEGQTLRVALTTLDQIKDHAERLTQLCEARREANR
jgi:hypothetical protein